MPISGGPISGLPISGLAGISDGACIPQTLNLAFENTADCCEQFPEYLDVPLHQVYRTKTYWNSLKVLPCYGYTTSSWSYQQFHFVCDRVGGNQKFRLYWCIQSPNTTRHCTICDGVITPPELHEWDFNSGTCDPWVYEFSLTGANVSPCCVDGAPGMGDPIPSCDFLATITA